MTAAAAVTYLDEERGLGNLDHGSDLIASLTQGVEIMNERALSRVSSCAHEVQAGQANIGHPVLR